MILNVVLVRALVASHENDQIEVPPNHAMEDADRVHEVSWWKCKINGNTNAYEAKWLLCQHLDNKHGLGGRQIWSSFYLCWGTKATKSLCHEHLNFEQPTHKPKVK